MHVAKTITSLKRHISRAKSNSLKVGFVPTMGALHEGHLSLVRKALKECDYVVVSIFVNPLQFGPNEDLDKYPRTFKQDEKYLRDLGVDVLFYPNNEAMYFADSTTFVEEIGLSSYLCGERRPGHFKGVTTIVCKLFNVVQADIAYFGQKDYQQFKIIQRMVRDLCMPIKVKGCPIVRESNGLALSSRNRYLSELESAEAASIFKALKSAKCLIASKNSISSRELKNFIRKEISLMGVKHSIDYIEIRDADTLKEVKKISSDVVIAIAVFVGKTRLIDNIVIKK